MEKGLDPSIRMETWAVRGEGPKAWGRSVKISGYPLRGAYFQLFAIHPTSL